MSFLLDARAHHAPDKKPDDAQSDFRTGRFGDHRGFARSIEVAVAVVPGVNLGLVTHVEYLKRSIRHSHQLALKDQPARRKARMNPVELSDPPPLEPRSGPLRRTSHRAVAPAISLICGAVMLTICWKPAPLLVWNVSNSAPVGLYVVTAASAPVRDDMILSQMPSAWRQLASSRRYLPANVPLLKRVAAVPGDTICAGDNRIWINGHVIARRLVKDRLGRPMPAWSGCRTLERNELFLLMAESAASFDGRYFGPTARNEIIGKARLLWPRRFH